MTTLPVTSTIDVPLATPTTDGLMSAADKTKLDGLTGGGGGGSIQLRDEGSVVSTSVTSLNFVGTAVTAAADGTITVDALGGPAGAPGDTPLVIMTAGGTLAGPSVIVTGGTAFTLLSTANIQNIENERTVAITASPPTGFTFRTGSTGNISAGSRAVFQLVQGVSQVKRLA